jgi:uncharacterized phage protein (TIGR02218 family)
MKNISVGLKNHLAGETTTLATLWKITRADGQIFGFTDHDTDIVYAGLAYEAATGFTPSAIETTSQFNVDNLEMQGLISSETITEDDLRAGRWDYALVEVMKINYADTSQGVMYERKGRLGEIQTGRVAFTAELRGLTQNLQQEVGRIYMPVCTADLGDAKCGINLASFTVSGAVTTAVSLQQFNDSSRVEADNHFKHGLLTFTSGLNNGLKMEVKANGAAGLITLQQAMPYAINVGDTYTMYAGCDKTHATCIAKFNNVVNFRGFPFIPGRDRVLSGKS